MHPLQKFLALLLVSLTYQAAAQSQLGLQWADANGTGFSQRENITAMARNAQGDVYIAGATWGKLKLAPGVPGGEITSPNSTEWPFVAKYNAQGQLQWLKAIEALGQITDVAIGPGNSIILTGYVDHVSDLDPGPGQALTVDNDGHTGFLKPARAGRKTLRWTKVN